MVDFICDQATGNVIYYFSQVQYVDQNEGILYLFFAWQKVCTKTSCLEHTQIKFNSEFDSFDKS